MGCLVTRVQRVSRYSDQVRVLSIPWIAADNSERGGRNSANGEIIDGCFSVAYGDFDRWGSQLMRLSLLFRIRQGI